MPRETHRSSASLFVRPSSFASSCTRIFPATGAVVLSFVQRIGHEPNRRSAA
jgi:hypothetical protein